MQIQWLLPWIAALLLTNSSPSAALPWADGETPPGPYVDNEQLFMLLRLHTPDQIGAFYEARGFPPAAIERIRQTCFITVHIDNKSNRILWLETSNWHITQNGKPVQRLGFAYWDSVWDEIGLPQANRSTFGWTQLPDVRDLQPAEPVGGNFVLPRNKQPYTIAANFHTGKDKRLGLAQVKFDQLYCAEDPPEQ
ncbi:MAG: hypothetical protein ABFS22_04835 [Pseudomonadota bacterium]